MSPPTAHYPARLIQLRLSVQMGTYRDLIFTLFFKRVLHYLIHTWHISPTLYLFLALSHEVFTADIMSQGKIVIALKSFFFFFQKFTHATHTSVKLFHPPPSHTLIILRSVFTLKSNPVKSKQHANSVISVKAITMPLTQTHIPIPFCISRPQAKREKTALSFSVFFNFMFFFLATSVRHAQSVEKIFLQLKNIQREFRQA